MIADDEPKIRQGLKSVLEEMKLPITVCAEARNGMEALEKIEQFQPDFILMDICMPKLSGIQFLEELRKLDKNCPVIVISGFNEFSYAKQAIKLGVSEYLLKPIAEEELQAAVVKVTEEIKQKRKSEKFMELVKQQMIQHQDYLRDVFFNEWMEGKLSRFEWEEQARFLDMDFPDNMILILVSVQSSYDKKIDKGTVTEEIYKITLEKIIRELMEPYHTVSVFSSKYEDVAIVMEKLPENFQEFSADLQLQTEEKVGGKCFITARECTFETLPDISGDEVVGMQICTQGDYLLVVSENGMGKRTPMAEFTVQLRGGKGVKCYKITEKTGNLIGSKAVNEDNEIMMITTEGIIIRTPCSGISVMGRITSGVKLMDVDGEIKVASIAKVRDKEASEETSVSEKENETASEKTQE